MSLILLCLPSSACLALVCPASPTLYLRPPSALPPQQAEFGLRAWPPPDSTSNPPLEPTEEPTPVEHLDILGCPKGVADVGNWSLLRPQSIISSQSVRLFKIFLFTDFHFINRAMEVQQEKGTYLSRATQLVHSQCHPVV